LVVVAPPTLDQALAQSRITKDLRHLILADRPHLQDAVALVSGEARPRGIKKKPTARALRYEAIDKALRGIAEAAPKRHREVFDGFNGSIDLPFAEPFASAGGWLTGYRRDRVAARVWLSKTWSRLNLRPFTRGSKSSYGNYSLKQFLLGTKPFIVNSLCVLAELLA